MYLFLQTLTSLAEFLSATAAKDILEVPLYNLKYKSLLKPLA